MGMENVSYADAYVTTSSRDFHATEEPVAIEVVPAPNSTAEDFELPEDSSPKPTARNFRPSINESTVISTTMSLPNDGSLVGSVDSIESSDANDPLFALFSAIRDRKKRKVRAIIKACPYTVNKRYPYQFRKVLNPRAPLLYTYDGKYMLPLQHAILEERRASLYKEELLNEATDIVDAILKAYNFREAEECDVLSIICTAIYFHQQEVVKELLHKRAEIVKFRYPTNDLFRTSVFESTMAFDADFRGSICVNPFSSTETNSSGIFTYFKQKTESPRERASVASILQTTIPVPLQKILPIQHAIVEERKAMSKGSLSGRATEIVELLLKNHDFHIEQDEDLLSVLLTAVCSHQFEVVEAVLMSRKELANGKYSNKDEDSPMEHDSTRGMLVMEHAMSIEIDSIKCSDAKKKVVEVLLLSFDFQKALDEDVLSLFYSSVEHAFPDVLKELLENKTTLLITHDKEMKSIMQAIDLYQQLKYSIDIQTKQDELIFYLERKEQARKSLDILLDYYGNYGFDKENIKNAVITVLSRLPMRFKRRVCHFPSLQNVLKEAILSPLCTAVLMADFYSHILIIVCYGIMVERLLVRDDQSFSMFWIVTGVCIGLFWFFIRELYQIICLRNTPGSFITDLWNWLDVLYLISVSTAIILLTQSKNSEKIKEFASLVCLIIWLKFCSFLKFIRLDFALFVGMVVDIAKSLISFLIFFFISMVAFAQAFHVVGLREYFGGALFTVYVMVLGEYAILEDEGEGGAPKPVTIYSKIIFSIFAFLNIVMLLNVLIAIATYTYENAKEKGRETFWLNRMNFVIEMRGSSITKATKDDPVLPFWYETVAYWMYRSFIEIGCFLAGLCSFGYFWPQDVRGRLLDFRHGKMKSENEEDRRASYKRMEFRNSVTSWKARRSRRAKGMNENHNSTKQSPSL